MEEIVLGMSNTFSVSLQTAYKVYANSFMLKQRTPGESSQSKTLSLSHSLWSAGTSNPYATFRLGIAFLVGLYTADMFMT